MHGRIEGDLAERERGALATLYVALMTDHMLARLGVREGPIVVDGNLGANAAFGAVLAQLRPGQKVVSTRQPIGAAYGAAMLASWPNCPALPELVTHRSWDLDSLSAYREAWTARSLAETLIHRRPRREAIVRPRSEAGSARRNMRAHVPIRRKA